VNGPFGKRSAAGLAEGEGIRIESMEYLKESMEYRVWSIGKDKVSRANHPKEVLAVSG
jgi:hypothetical protein